MMKEVLFAVSVDADKVGIPKIEANDATFNLIVGLIYTIIAAVSLFYIVRGALLFVTSGSDPASVKAARETILYAVIGLAGSTAVFALIGFVLRRLG